MRHCHQSRVSGIPICQSLEQSISFESTKHLPFSSMNSISTHSTLIVSFARRFLGSSGIAGNPFSVSDSILPIKKSPLDDFFLIVKCESDLVFSELSLGCRSLMPFATRNGIEYVSRWLMRELSAAAGNPYHLLSNNDGKQCLSER